MCIQWGINISVQLYYWLLPCDSLSVCPVTCGYFPYLASLVFSTSNNSQYRSNNLQITLTMSVGLATLQHKLLSSILLIDRKFNWFLIDFNCYLKLKTKVCFVAKGPCLIKYCRKSSLIECTNVNKLNLYVPVYQKL